MWIAISTDGHGVIEDPTFIARAETKEALEAVVIAHYAEVLREAGADWTPTTMEDVGNLCASGEFSLVMFDLSPGVFT